jgi:hypothetical protein
LRFQFAADPRHAAEVTSLLSQRLGSSLRHVAERSAGHVDVLEARTTPLIQRLEAGDRAAPDTFAVHHDMLRAIDTDDLDELQVLFHELADTGPPHDGMRILGFSVDDLGDRRLRRYGRHAGDDPDHPVRFVASGATNADFAARVTSAMRFLAAAAPAVAGEIEAVVSEVVSADPDLTADGRSYGGISAFPLWGAIFINPGLVRDDLDCVSVLVHETTHLLLFAYSLDEPLVLNPGTDVFESPLREDSRPMDGILHATCVIARMHDALRTCVRSGRLRAVDEDSALARLDELAASCARGMEVVRAHADLTATGRAVVDAVERYMGGEVH